MIEENPEGNRITAALIKSNCSYENKLPAEHKLPLGNASRTLETWDRYDPGLHSDFFY